MKAGHFGAAFALAAMVGMSGCASIVSDSKPKVGVYSLPRETTYTITDSTGRIVSKGQTPGEVILESSKGYFKRETYTVAFHREGYADDVQTAKSKISGWYWGNIAFGGLIGLLIVDPLTGAMYTLPDQVIGKPAPLAPAQASAN